MQRINLREYYPFYQQDCFMELSEEIVECLKPYRREEQSHRRRMRLHKVYSLDRDGLENTVFFSALSPDELYERKLTYQELYAAIASLPDKQAKRIYAHYFLGMTFSDIARAEQVRESAVRDAISLGLCSLEKYIKLFF